MSSTGDTVLRVRDLQTHFHTDQGVAKAVDGVSFDLKAGETLAVVGESGCGKSVTALSVLGLVPTPPGRIEGGEVRFGDRDLLAIPPEELRALRGNDISMIFQEPMTSMNPVFRVGAQIGAVLRRHRKLDKAAAREETVALLKKVGIPAPERRVDNFPHEMSGGMLQRVMIAMALACRPKVLIADEPTTALDVTIQAQILSLLKELQNETGMAMLLITHDLGVVAEVADEVAVMYAGKVVEHAKVDSLFTHRAHPYTRGLFASLPGLHARGSRLSTIDGNVPAATQFPAGCRFHPRCPHAMDHCGVNAPSLIQVEEDHHASCWLHDADVMAQQGRPTGVPDAAAETTA